MPEANENPVTPTERLNSLNSDISHDLRLLQKKEENILSMCVHKGTNDLFSFWEPHQGSSPIARRNKDCEDYQTISMAVHKEMVECQNVRLLLRQKDHLLIAELRNLERDVRSLKEENAGQREEIEEIRKLSSEREMEMDEKVGQMRIKEEKLREAQEQEVRHLKRENEMLQKEIDKERQLIREDVRREMELKAHEIGVKERTLREAQELGERVKMNADSLVARD